MSMKKSLLLSFAAMAIAMTAFASPAMAATDGVIKDGSTPIANGTLLNAKGWAKFETLGTGIECHVTSTVEALGAGTAGSVTAFAPNETTCRGFGSIYKGCKVKTGTIEVLNLPYAATVTPTDIDITATNIQINSELKECENPEITFTELFFESGITLRLLGTGTRAVTNTNTTLGATITTNTSIAGIELEGLGEAVNDIGELGVKATGELEIEGSNRCTYHLEVA